MTSQSGAAMATSKQPFDWVRSQTSAFSQRFRHTKVAPEMMAQIKRHANQSAFQAYSSGW